MLKSEDVKAISPQTTLLDEDFNILVHLRLLKQWREEWEQEDSRLAQKVYGLDGTNKIDLQKSAQIAIARRRARLKLVQQPIELAPKVFDKVGINVIRKNLGTQFMRLTKDQRLDWMQNFLFIMTPDIRLLNDKITAVMEYNALGQQRNFLLGGESGMGKTSYLDWLVMQNPASIESERTHVPIIKIDAPVNQQSAKPLFQRLILACGKNYVENDKDETLLMKLILFIQQCDVKLIIVDEIQHNTRHRIRRRLLEISNQTYGVPIICAACNPQRWTDGDTEVAGRWNDFFPLEVYKGKRISQLLGFVEVLLPFTKASNLYLYKLKDPRDKRKRIAGPAQLIERWTGGVLRDIMILLVDASKRAIESGASNLSPELLETTWKSIQANQVKDVWKAIQRRK